MTDDDTADTLRDDLAESRRDCATYRALALAGLDSLHAAYDRIGVLERLLAEERTERIRYTSERCA